MMCLSKIKLLLAATLAAYSLALPLTGVAWAGIDTYDCFNPKYKDLPKAQANKADDQATKQLKSQYYSLTKALDQLCKTADDNHFEVGYTSQKNLEDDIKADGKWEEYQAKLKQLETIAKQINALKATDNACGDKYPYGCPDGTVCMEHNTSYSTEFSDITMRSFSCKSPDEKTIYGSSHQVDNSKVGSVTMSVGGPTAISNVVTSDGDSKVATFSLLNGFHGLDDFNQTGEVENLRTNAACKIEEMKQDYLSTCYSCVIVSTLIRTFMNITEVTYPLTQEAGITLLTIGMFLWLAFFVLGKISSFVSLEPMDMLNELFKFFFKCLVAYTLITSGLKMLTVMLVNPILEAGADYGIGIIDSVTPSSINIDGYTSQDTRTYKLSSSGVMDQKVFSKIMDISKKADNAVSLNFVIGNALICHSTHAGAIQFAKKITDYVGIPFYFPDIWLWLCGAAIWFFAFMVVMGVNFYLLDLSFKIGFALLAFPITIGLWPFNKFKDKFAACLKIIINAAGTFMFLGITTGISIQLISAAMGGTDALFEAIAADNKKYISEKFSLTGGAFILILFAFLYSHKLISETVSKMADHFFSAVTSGMNPMHEKTTQAIDFAKKAVTTVATGVVGVAGGAANIAATAAKTAAKGAAKKAARGAVKGVRNFMNRGKQENE